MRERDDCVLVGVQNGPAVEADVLAGADGTRSRITQHLTGRPASRPSGLAAIGGTVFRPVRRPADLKCGPAPAGGPRGTGVSWPRTSRGAVFRSADDRRAAVRGVVGGRAGGPLLRGRDRDESVRAAARGAGHARRLVGGLQAKPALDWQRRLGNPLLRGLALEVALPVANAALRLLRT